MCNFNSKIICDKDDVFGNIMIVALRYALGRQTYITYQVANFIKENKTYIDDRVKKVMIEDINRYLDKGLLYDDNENDLNTILNLLTFLEGC